MICPKCCEEFTHIHYEGGLYVYRHFYCYTIVRVIIDENFKDLVMFDQSYLIDSGGKVKEITTNKVCFDFNVKIENPNVAYKLLMQYIDNLIFE